MSAPALLALLPFLLPAAQAGLPDRFAGVLSGDSSEVEDLVPSPDGLSLLFVDGSAGSLARLDLASWSLQTVSTCSGAQGLAVWEGAEQTLVYVGCSDGSVLPVALEASDQSAGVEILGEVGEAVDLLDGEVLGLLAEGELIYVLTQPDEEGATPRLHSLDPADGSIDGAADGASMPQSTAYSGFQDMALATAGALVLHGDDNLSLIPLPGGGLSSDDVGLGVLDGVDLEVSASGTYIYAGGGAAVARFTTGSNDWGLYLGADDGLEDVHGICLLEALEAMAVADGGRGELLLHDWDSAAGSLGSEALATLSWPDPAQIVTGLVGTAEDYLVVGTASGALWVGTDRPWVEITGASPSTAVQGDPIELLFESDRAGDYALRVGGTGDADGELLASGAVEAGVATALSVEVGDAFAEGGNALRVVVTDPDGRSGHDATLISVDNPPPRISLGEDAVGVGDGYLSLRFTAPSAEDLASVRVWVTVAPFEAADWPEGGPAFDGEDAISSPIELAIAPDQEVEVVISPLTNGRTYYLAARAIDAGGLEGEMSEVVSGMPEETHGVAELSGEPGGFCSTGPGAASALLAGLALAASGLRRRARPGRGTVGGGLVLLGLLLPLRAHAEDAALPAEAPSGEAPPAEAPPAEEAPAADPAPAAEPPAETAAAPEEPEVVLPTLEELIADEEKVRIHGSMELRLGPIDWEEGSAITEVLGDRGHNLVLLEGGPTLGRTLGLTVGGGFYRKKGTLQTASGGTSTQEDLFWAIPLTVNVFARLDVIKNQPFVPYATAGADGWLWRESWKTGTEDEREGIGGAKYGFHYGLGGQVLLDIFEPRRADSARARIDVQDTYLCVEWRRQEVGLFQEGLELNGSQVTFGLKLHR